MKRRVLFLMLVFVGLSDSAFARQNFVNKFLNRYKPPAESTMTPLTQDRLPALIRNGEIPLSVADLVNLTLENNLDINVNRLNPLASEYAIRTNYRPFEPTLAIEANFTSDASRSRTQLSSEFVSQFADNFSVSYFQTLQTGTDIGVEWALNRTSSNDAFSSFNPAWFTRMRYSFTQHLLNGFGKSVNTRGIRVAQNNKTISEVQFERMVIDLVTQAEKSYWDLVFAAADIKIKQDSLALAERTLKDNERQVEVGTLARIDLVQSRSQVSTRREELIVSNFTQAQIQDQIKKVFSREQDPGLVLARISPTQDANAPTATDLLPVADAIRVAFENRPELRQASLELRNSDIEIQYAKNQLLPILDVNANFNHSGVGGTETIRQGFGPDSTILEVIRGGAGDSFGDLLKMNNRGWAIGFSLQIPLGNKSQQAEYSRISVQKKTNEENIRALEQQIALEVRNAITAVEMNKARIDAAIDSRVLAAEQYQAEERRFALGASTVRFVLEEQRNLEQMQTNENAALVNYRKALVDYDRALGMTLKKNNISIEKTVAALR